MKITLNFYASLAQYLPSPSKGKPLVMEMEDGKTLKALMEELQVPDDDIKIVFLNGVHAKGDEVLKDGDRVGVFPPVAGG